MTFCNVKLGCMEKTIVGIDSDRLPPCTTIHWTPLTIKTQHGEPELKTVENPGQWSEFTFHPVFEKGGGFYKRHALPTGFMTPPQDISGTRKINGWEFHYNYQDDIVGTYRTPVDDSKQFHPERK